jgi:response regulator RpfG family c-di-GMP phosphodiesterase
MNDATYTERADAPESSPRVLFVDDEPSILNAMKRVFRGQSIEISTAGSGQAGLALLNETPVDLVISDMRMPEMDGAQFLEEVFTHWPQTKRILMTGYAEVASTIAAINRGKIWCYIAKPWDDEDLVITVQHALAHRQLTQQNARLADLTHRQNDELKQLNAGLEEKVATRTRELQAANADLRQSFLSTVHVFSNLIEQREGRLAGHSRRVADLARQLAERLGLDEAEQRNVLLAGLLHDIGKVGMPDRLFERPFNALSATEKQEVMRHPVRGQQLLTGIQQLGEAARVIRHLHECMDGSGYPDHLGGLMIPLGARILAVAHDFDELQTGSLALQQHSVTEALDYIVRQRGKRYDPTVINALAAIHTDNAPQPGLEITVTPIELKPGMVLTRDLLHTDGSVLLSKGRVVDAGAAAQLLRQQESEAQTLLIHVRHGGGPAVLRNRIETPPTRNWKEVALATTQLKEGMLLSRSLFHPGGYLLLARGNRLDDPIIRQLRDMEKFTGKPFTLHIRMDDR